MTAQEWWRGRTPAQQKGVIVLAALELVFTTAALWDLAHRPARQVRGPKAFWLLASAVQPFGPIAYLTLGRRAEADTAG
jgi:hypothetical protein